MPAQIPFILLTADGGQADVRPGPNLGADDYLVKPVEVADLPEAIVARAARRRRRPGSTRISGSPRLPAPDIAAAMQDFCFFHFYS